MGILAETSAHLAVATWDCTKPGCPQLATKRGPGGKPYCDEHRTEIYKKKVATTTRRHGTAGGGGHTKLLVASDRVAQSIDQLASRVRIEAKACERAARAAGRPDLAERRREFVLTMQALAVRLADL